MTIVGRAVDDNVVIFVGSPEQKAEVLTALTGLNSMKANYPATVVLGLEIASRDFNLHTITPSTRFNL